jgi:DNA-binding LacI/PurR family transcriptional regulator/AraC-like DNA-binding protein
MNEIKIPKRAPRGTKRIGLVLASIHTGIAPTVWPSFARTAIAENVSLFIFPGGRLNARPDFENLRNPVYYLVNGENLDGCISWSSTIRYTQSKEEFEHFHAGFDPLPYVTLSYKVPGRPCVEFDAYNGVKALIRHCIRVHGARRIAFLRGPDFHQSAEARFKGYYDALLEAGLVPGKKGTAPFESPLVTDPFNWNAGEAAAAQLFESRSLVPGRDFDTLVGSSDLMVLGAINYFAARGYHVPQDYHAAGFNNSVESMIAESPLSTVRLPYTELSRESFQMLLSLMGRKKRSPAGDIQLRSEPVIRESCGCVDFYGADRAAPPKNGTGKPAENMESALAEMAAEYLNPEAGGAPFLPVIQALLHEEPARSFPLFEKALIRFLNAGGDAENPLRLMGAVRASGLLPPETVSRLEPALYRIIFRIREQLNVRARYEKEQWNTALNSLKCDLLGTRDRFSLVYSLARHLPKIGINTAAIVLYGDEKTAIYAGGLSAGGISPPGDLRFPSRLLVPAAVRHQFSGGIFMVQPLFIENQSLGYFVHNVPMYDGVIFEELRSAISYALKGIFLLEETVRAKRIAEQAERAQTEFLQTLEKGLYDPIQGVMERLETLEQNAAACPPAVLRELGNLKSFVSSRETEAGSFVDFTLSQIDGLSPRKTMFDPAELLPGIGIFPLLAGDASQLARCFSLVREQYRESPVAALTYGGLSIVFRGKAGEGQRFGLLLAERIIRTHGGEWFRDGDRCVITLPWTTLTGQEPAKRPPGPRDHILVLSDPASLPANMFDLPRITGVEKALALPGLTAFIVWNSAGARSEDLIKIAGLRHKSEFAALPFLCYGGKPVFENAGFESSVIDAVENALQSPQKGTVLLIGPEELWGAGRLLPEKERPGGEQAETIRIDSMAAFNETVGELSPSLIVFNALNPAAAAEIRRHPLTVMVPIVMLSGRIDNAAAVKTLSQYSRLIICHWAAAESAEFRERLQALAAGDEILPPHTGVLVKKAILYFGQHLESRVSRWKLADTINVSEDYLTRIFRREMGLSLWDYLNRCRIFLAAELLRGTDDPIQDIALRTGFNDQTYFCRVFKKITGVPPGQLRKS